MSNETLTPEAIDAGLESYANDFLSGSGDNSDSNTGTPAELVTLAEEMLDVGEEPSDQVSEADESKQESDEAETAKESDDDTPVKAEEDVETDDEPTDDDVNEYFEVSYEDAKDGVYPIKIGGEVKMMKFSEIQNQLARSESASKKSQEANQQLEEIKAKEEALAQSEEWLKQRTQASVESDQLQQLSGQYSQAQSALNKAREDNDMFQVTRIKDVMEQIGAKYNEIATNVKATNEEAERRHTEAQLKILQDKGYGDVITDSYKSYLNDNLTEQAISAISMDATLAIALEKARKWDASQGKGKRALKKGKSLAAGGGNIKQAKANKQQAISKAMSQGQGSQDDALSGIDAIAKDILFG